MGVVAETIRARLEEAFAPVSLAIIDESHLHAGHRGHDSRGESHFKVTMQSAAFAGKSRVERERMVHTILADQLRDRVHALSLSLSAPA